MNRLKKAMVFFKLRYEVPKATLRVKERGYLIRPCLPILPSEIVGRPREVIGVSVDMVRRWEKELYANRIYIYIIEQHLPAGTEVLKAVMGKSLSRVCKFFRNLPLYGRQIRTLPCPQPMLNRNGTPTSVSRWLSSAISPCFPFIM
ncbi:MAG TPA: hypothetical protein DCP92_07220 [Nitrospiraceae bacterium]|nr:hypothetical protein [Nitrospiraceae bacterium]